MKLFLVHHIPYFTYGILFQKFSLCMKDHSLHLFKLLNLLKRFIMFWGIVLTEGTSSVLGLVWSWIMFGVRGDRQNTLHFVIILVIRALEFLMAFKLPSSLLKNALVHDKFLVCSILLVKNYKSHERELL